MNIAIVGGGISGLSTAYYLQRRCPRAQLTLFDADQRVGGVLRTVREGDYLLECAADNFLRGPTAPWAESLCQAMGFADELIPTFEKNRGAHVVWQGRLLPVPAGFQLMAPSRLTPILKSPLLSWRGKLRLCAEPLIREPRMPPEDESLTEFATRRLGVEAFERLVQPLVAGIYTADPDRLSVRAALPQMVDMVQQHGSLYKAMRARQRQAKRDATASQDERGARYGLFVAPRQGMQQWVDALRQTLTAVDIRCGAEITGASQAPEASHASGASHAAEPNVSATQQSAGSAPLRWILQGTESGTPFSRAFDALVLATPTFRAARILRNFDSGLADQLEQIQYAGSVVVAMGFRRDQVAQAMNAFGSVVPRSEERPILAISYSSLKFPDRAPGDRVLMRVFLGGAVAPHWVDEEDAMIIATVRQQLSELLGVRGDPELCRVIRWPRAMPQYQLGHLARLQQIRQRLETHPGLYLAGNGYEGVGIPQCVNSGRQAADALASWADEGAAS